MVVLVVINVRRGVVREMLNIRCHMTIDATNPNCKYVHNLHPILSSLPALSLPH